MHRYVILLRIRIHPRVHEGRLWHRMPFVLVYLLGHITQRPLITSADPPSTSTVNATSEFRKIRQSLSLLESHLTTLQRVPRPLPDAAPCETRIQPQRGLLTHLSSPLSSWPTQLNPGVGPTGWISYLGM